MTLSAITVRFNKTGPIMTNATQIDPVFSAEAIVQMLCVTTGLYERTGVM